jgi:hypothetical protein
MVIDFMRNRRTAAPPAGFATLRGYWEALRIGQTLPHRAAIDPRGLGTCLHQVMIAEQIAPGLARLRLAGSVFTDVMGMEVRGMPLSALFEPMARAGLEAHLAEVFAGRTAVTLDLVAERGLGRPALTGQLLLLPLIGDEGVVDLAIGCLALHGVPGRTPRRFHVAGVQRENLITGLAEQTPSAQIMAFAEAAVRFQPKGSYLRVVK